MKTNCDKIMDDFLMLDKGQRLPVKISMHLLKCKKCRSEVRSLTKAEKLSGHSLNLKTPLTDASIVAIMQKVDPSYKPKKYKVSFAQWIIIGFLMILGMLCFGIYTHQSRDLTIAFYMVFAGAVVFYTLLFVASNMDFFVKKISRLSA